MRGRPAGRSAYGTLLRSSEAAKSATVMAVPRRATMPIRQLALVRARSKEREARVVGIVLPGF